MIQGADDTIQDNEGRDALKWAEKKNSQDGMAVKVLKARKEHPDKVTKQIMEEAKKENVKWGLVKSLIAVHPDINYLNQNGETALRLAWNAENIKLVRLLLDKGAQFDVQNANGETSLQIEEYIESIKKDLQKVILVNFAAYKSDGLLANYTVDEWDKTFDINIKSNFFEKSSQEHLEIFLSILFTYAHFTAYSS